MNRIFLFVFSLLIGALAQRSPSSYREICVDKAQESFSSLNYRGPSLTSNFDNDVILCPGDTFGDLNETYVTFHHCYFGIYHQGKEIGSLGEAQKEKVDFCAVSLEKDGTLALYKETEFRDYLRQIIWLSGDYETDFRPKKNELRIKNKQLQIVHTLQDGSERIFYTGTDIRGEFREYLGAPKQIAEKFLIINYTDPSEYTILRRNEYIGDLNGMHLILQTTCELQLNNNNQTIWSFPTRLNPGQRCTLSVQEGNSIGITKIPENDSHFRYYYHRRKLFPPNDLTVLQSKITFQEERLLIIQTLKNGSEITFYSEPGHDVGLKLKRHGKQIARNKVTFSSETILRRMDYIGDLNGLHLILRDNCALTLAHGREELWKLQESLSGPFMECRVQFNGDGTIMFYWDKNVDKSSRVQIFGKKWYEKGGSPSKFRLSLENNMMILTLKYKYPKKTIHVYHAGLNTMGTWFQFLSGNSFIVTVNDKKDKIFPEMSYIGDINGVYAVLHKRGNWILFNKTLPIWESGTTQPYGDGFVVILAKDGNVAVTQKWKLQKEDFLWSSQTSDSYKEAKLSQSEIFVNNDGLWLNNIYVDGVVKRFKALEGTNSFIALPAEEEIFKRPPSFQSFDL